MQSKINIKLKTSIILSGYTQRQLSEQIGIKEQVISGAIHERLLLSESEKQKIADALGRRPEDLFE